MIMMKVEDKFKPEKMRFYCLSKTFQISLKQTASIKKSSITYKKRCIDFR